MFLAQPGGRPISGALVELDVSVPRTFIIGPEGGFTGREVESLTLAGAQPIDLGARTLRIETAAVACVATAMTVTRVND